MVGESAQDKKKDAAGSSARSSDTDDGTDSAGGSSSNDTTAAPIDIASPAIPVFIAATAKFPATTSVEDHKREEEVVYVPSEVVDVVVGVGGANVAHFERMSGRSRVCSHRTQVP